MKSVERFVFGLVANTALFMNLVLMIAVLSLLQDFLGQHAR